MLLLLDALVAAEVAGFGEGGAEDDAEVGVWLIVRLVEDSCERSRVMSIDFGPLTQSLVGGLITAIGAVAAILVQGRVMTRVEQERERRERLEELAGIVTTLPSALYMRLRNIDFHSPGDILHASKELMESHGRAVIIVKLHFPSLEHNVLPQLTKLNHFILDFSKTPKAEREEFFSRWGPHFVEINDACMRAIIQLVDKKQEE